ncbi:MAG: OsmC family protein [Acidobacteria bacterium]|nr:OsmC family protein [Acidobacteriota bacterium]MBI3279751.1 OsmC family protein [Acidobacteriota bacterium]
MSGVREHHYTVSTSWTGNLGTGTSSYRAYSRSHEYAAPGKEAPILASSDPAFRGDGRRYNPEELLVAAISGCHMLWLLHLCAAAGIVVTRYSDEATGDMRQNQDGSGEFVRVLLRPRMTITDAARVEEAAALHRRAQELCFVARSVNFPVEHEPVVIAG